MQSRKNLFSLVLLILVFSLALSACASEVPVTGNEPSMMEDKDEMKDDSMSDEMMDKEDEMMADKDDSMMEEDKMDDPHDDSMMDEKDDTMMDDGVMMDSPEWFAYQFTNVNTGEMFSINDLKGKVVLVETMATWCSNCLKQQKEVKTLHDLLGERDDFVSFGLDIDLNENADQLQSFVQKQGFDWTYAISNDTVAREIGNLYGSQFLNPPSTPMLIIDRKGEVHTLPFGIKSAEDLLEALQPFLETSM